LNVHYTKELLLLGKLSGELLHLIIDYYIGADKNTELESILKEYKLSDAGDDGPESLLLEAVKKDNLDRNSI
jgi:hypothetical protein